MRAFLTRPVAQAAATNPIDRLRRRGVRAWAIIGWASLAAILAADMFIGAGAGRALLLVGLLMNAGPTYMALRGRHDAEARAMAGVLAALLPAMLVFLLKGNAWQMDAHMYFFVGTAALVMLADWRPIVLATVLTAAHHLLLEWLAPEWVFNGSGNIGRVVFHAVAVVLQCGVLTALVLQLERLLLSQDDALLRSRELAVAAEDGQQRTEHAMRQARAAEAAAAGERRRREEQAARIAVERRDDLVRLASAFERSVTSVVRSIAGGTERLEQAAVELENVSAGGTREAVEVARGATRAASNISQVAASIRDMSGSIRTIAIAADQQSALTARASIEAAGSVRTAAMLEEQAGQIEAFLNNIRDIAQKTNLLALNATIEAARAGDAGRGFAVVAAEVKALSADTRRASDLISRLVSGIREGVAETGGKLRSVDGAIGQVSSAASGIAAAVGEQQSTTQEVNDGAGRAVESAQEIERRIEGVARAAGAASCLAATVRGDASDLAASARDLHASTDRFVTFLRSEDAMAA